MKQEHQNNIPNWVERIRKDDEVVNRVSSKEENLRKLRKRLDAGSKRSPRPWLMFAAAASVLMFFAVRIVMTTDGDPGLQNNVATKPTITKGDSAATVSKDIKRVESITNLKGKLPVTGKIASGKRDQVVTAQPIVDSLAAKDSGNAIVMIQKQDQQDSSDLAIEPPKLPRVHINDITSKEPLPPNISSQGLSIRKLIGLFNLDVTSAPSKTTAEKIPESPYTIPNHQN